MKRAVIGSLVLVIVLATLGSLWFLRNFERVPTAHWQAPEKEAQRNPYLALERLFGKLGRPLERVQSPRALDALPAGGILILDKNRRRNVDPARAERLLNWVQGGGYLIVAAENSEDDPLLRKLGLSPYRASPLQCDAGDPNEAVKPASGLKTPPAPIELSLPGSAIRYRYRRPGIGLSSSLPAPVWHAGLSETRNAVLHFAWGRGQITVLDDLRFLGNRQIGELDHAELIWALTQQYQPQGEIRLASRMEFPTLWQWLIESASMALISVATLIGLWLWRIIPRFGGTLAPPDNERRDLVQHLSAIGRSVWREGGITHWLTVVRQSISKRIARRHPQLSPMENPEQQIALARLAECQTKDIGSALTPGQAQTPKEFTKAMQTLQRLDQRLANMNFETDYQEFNP